MATKCCKTCKRDLPTTEYHTHYSNKDGFRTSCKTCRTGQHKAYRAAKKAPAFQGIGHKYGITPAQYNALLLAQDGQCIICGESDPHGGRTFGFCVDHDHATGEIRGLLCNSCNSGLGMFRDNPRYLQRAIHYLQSYRHITAAILVATAPSRFGAPAPAA
jgi:hypothetical protein